MQIACECGRLIGDGADGMPNQAHVMPDQRWHHVLKQIDPAIEQGCSGPDAPAASYMRVRETPDRASRSAWQCTGCGTLYLDDASHRPHAFAPRARDEARGIISRAREGAG